jgi:hypothetical protein
MQYRSIPYDEGEQARKNRHNDRQTGDNLSMADIL